MKTMTWYASDRRHGHNPNTLHVETEGCFVNIQVGLHDSEGREVTRVDIVPDDESRGSDNAGRTWHRDGPRIIRQHEGYASQALPVPPLGTWPADGSARVVYVTPGQHAKLAEVAGAFAGQKVTDGDVTEIIRRAILIIREEP